MVGNESATSCRLCAVRCDQVVQPAGCLASRCDRLYSYEEDGRMYIGCLERVFGVDIDLEAFRELESGRRGFGGLRIARPPLPQCRTAVEAAMPHRLPGPCVNPGMGSPVSAPHSRRDDDPERRIDGQPGAVD